MSGMLDRVKGWLFEEEETDGVPIGIVDSQPALRKRKSSILSLHGPKGEEIFIRRPRSREDAPACADCLRARCPVIVNLKSLDNETSLRVFDFLAGVVYALDGQMETIGEGIFLLTPRDVEIAGELEDSSSSVQPEDIGFWHEQ